MLPELIPGFWLFIALAALAGLLRRERALLAGLDDAERRHLADLMRILLAPFDAAE